MVEVLSTHWKRPPYWLLTMWLLICFGVSALGNVITISEISSWYPSIVKPSFNPPNWIFGPVWTTLYILMAIAAWRVDGVTAQTESKSDSRLLTWIFLTQLILNGIWSPIFFAWHQLGMALVDILLLWITISTFTVLAWKQDRISAYLFVPYWCWVSFAMVLNFAIWRLNP